jgi:hypothetical protein
LTVFGAAVLHRSYAAVPTQTPRYPGGFFGPPPARLDGIAFQELNANMDNVPFPKNNEVRDRWRIAIVGYREGLRRGESNNPCVKRGAAALREAFPEMTETEAVRRPSLRSPGSQIPNTQNGSGLRCRSVSGSGPGITAVSATTVIRDTKTSRLLLLLDLGDHFRQPLKLWQAVSPIVEA